MSHRPFKDRLYAEFATIGKALASAHRLELLDLLGQGERSVDELAQEIGQSLANTSAHLQVLRQARLVEADKRGLNVVYRLAAPEVFTLWSTLRDLGTTRLAEIDRLVETFLSDRSTLAAVDIAPLMLERASDNVTRAALGEKIAVEHGDICSLRFADRSFDRVVAEAVTMFVDRPHAARELVRVCKPGGRVLATEFYWRKPPTPEARRLFLFKPYLGLIVVSGTRPVTVEEA